jgi:hypothetical protein
VGERAGSNNNCPGYCRRTKVWVRQQYFGLSYVFGASQPQQILSAHLVLGAPAVRGAALSWCAGSICWAWPGAGVPQPHFTVGVSYQVVRRQ